MFEPLPPETVERLASQLQPLVAEEETVVIRRATSATASTSSRRDGQRRRWTARVVAVYEPSDGFGEIAPLHDVPRTATVRVVTPSRIMALDRPHFLSVLTDEPASMIAAERLAADRLLDTAAQRARHERVEAIKKRGWVPADPQGGRGPVGWTRVWVQTLRHPG